PRCGVTSRSLERPPSTASMRRSRSFRARSALPVSTPPFRSARERSSRRCSRSRPEAGQAGTPPMRCAPSRSCCASSAQQSRLVATLGEDMEAAEPGGARAQDLWLVLEEIEKLDAVLREVLGFAAPRPGENVELTVLVRSALYVLGQEGSRRKIEIDSAQVEE